MTTANEEFQLSEETLSILGHLNELRIRLTYAAIGLLIKTIISFFFAEDILNFLLAPYASGQLQVLRPTEGIETFFKVAFTAGAILSMPVILYQLWQFISPGLTKQERRYVYIFLPSALIAPRWRVPSGPSTPRITRATPRRSARARDAARKPPAWDRSTP